MSLFRKNKEFIIEEIEQEFKEKNPEIKAPDALSSDEILNNFTVNDTPVHNNALESLRKKVQYNASGKKEGPKPKDTDTLVEKCKVYLTDEDGTDVTVDREPLYKLQTVAEILKSESNKTLEELSKKYDLIFEGLDAESTKEETAKTTSVETSPLKKEKEQETEESAPKVLNVQSNVPFIISDLEAQPIPESPKDMSQTATVTFTPVAVSDTANKISVSTRTMPIDLTGELIKLPDSVNIKEEEEEHILEKNEFEEYIPEKEFGSMVDAPKLKRFFSIKNRNSFLNSVFSVFITLILAASKIPFINAALLSNPTASMSVFFGIFLIAVILNFDMFASLKHFLKKKGSPDILTTIATLLTIATSLVAIVTGSLLLEILILMGIILSIRSITNFFRFSTHLSNLKLLSSKTSKNAIKLIGDSALCSSMAKNAIEGDVLIAAEQKADFINDYIKYSTFGKFLGGKLPLITIISMALSAILGLASFTYFSSALEGLYSATAVMIFSCLPCVYLIDTLPLYRTSKKLREHGAVIAGKTGAEQLEMANAVVLSSKDFFPKGTITLHHMEVLSHNNLEDTIVRAAALTEYIGSTLSPIFKTITNSANITSLPNADTVKYEDRLGISGWVDNRLLFIGNRTLMETHGIEVPPIEVDYNILRNGFFPIYVATREKACALLVVQYNVDTKIARELKKLTGLGVTILVNSSDPNLTDEMLCDYFGLYKDTVKVMSAAGCYMHKNATVPIDKISSPAMCREKSGALPKILNCASKIKKSNGILSVFYVIFACLGILLFAYSSFSGSSEIFSATSLLIYGMLSTVISYLSYLIKRP